MNNRGSALENILGLMGGLQGLEHQEAQTGMMEQEAFQRAQMHPLMMQKAMGEAEMMPQEQELVRMKIQELMRRMEGPYISPELADMAKGAGYMGDRQAYRGLLNSLNILPKGWDQEPISPQQQQLIDNMLKQGYKPSISN